MIEFIEYEVNDAGQTIYARVDEDGLIRYTCIESDPAYQAWLNPVEHFTPSLQPKLDKWNYRMIPSKYGTYTFRTDLRAVTQSL